MTYPAAFVLIAQGDLPMEQPPPVPAAQGLTREQNHCSVPLTPPTSPEQPCSGNKYAQMHLPACTDRTFNTILYIYVGTSQSQLHPFKLCNKPFNTINK